MRARAILGMLLLLSAPTVLGARISDVRNTTHNLSISGPGAIKSTTETQICIFCHTPHSAETILQAPLWNRAVAGDIYTNYDTPSMDAVDKGQMPTLGSSRLCLSCHDGTMAIAAVNVKDGSYTDRDPLTGDMAMVGTGAGGVMPAGGGLLTGNTRNLGVNLTNDHPISFTYDATTASKDGDLFDPATTTHIANPSPGVKPLVPLDQNKMECISCHDPHMRDTVEADIKFMRLNRFQTNAAPSDATFNPTNDIICLACHRKDGYWGSAHANPLVADEIYTAAGAARFGFPNGLPVWRASCLNCHEAHTVQGARRLLREGTDSLTTPKSGGNSALEETCFLCHTTPATSVLVAKTPNEVPDIKSDLALLYNMPMKSSEQRAGTEVHDPGLGGGDRLGRDYVESQLNLGKGDLTRRHAECTDCHNAHRVAKTDYFNSDPNFPNADGTHFHPTNNTSGQHTNIASGALRATWGVEPTYGGTEFTTLPVSYEVKRGIPAVGGPTDAGQVYVTREYQVCLKCHSDYAFNDASGAAGWNNAGRPVLGQGGGTPSGTNGMTVYTNQAMEFQAPEAHKGEPAGPGGSGAAAAYTTNNHRSWHPVMKETGRTKAVRKITSTTTFMAPFDAGVGTQTMYCTDCHGLDTATVRSDPDPGENFGPHGSENKFMLRGEWSAATGGTTSQSLCFKCHSFSVYSSDGVSSSGKTGFNAAGFGNLHALHFDKANRYRCVACHVAVPHGWKNKSLLVNLNDVGPEVGLAAGTQISDGNLPYTRGPYYLNAYNKIKTFQPSGSWTANSCQGPSGSDGKSWMKDVCG